MSDAVMPTMQTDSGTDLGTAFARVENASLHLVLLPTESCNFRCIYCYEEFRHTRMEPWVVRGVKRLLSRRAAGLESLTLSWFGGEPLLARDLIEDLMMHVGGLARENPGLRVSADATTNGYLLTPTVAERLVELGVSRYQISFDGPRDWHDRKRVLAGGRGTFDRIWGNLLELRRLERDFTITIRVHVDRENVGVVPRFIHDCAEAFRSDSRFELFIRGLARLGGMNDASQPVFERAEGDAVLEELRSFARSLGLRTMPFPPADPVCYAARANSYVVRADGRLNKCTVALEHPDNQVGRINEDGTVDVDSEKLGVWMRGLGSSDPAELKCPMKGLADPPERSRGEAAVALTVTPATR